MELRCPAHQLFGVMRDNLLEVRCRNSRCGYERGVIVLHYFNPSTGEFVKTERYKDPSKSDTFRNTAV